MVNQLRAYESGLLQFSNESETMIAYFDCFSGISGDMTLGALIDLGVPVKWLKEALSSIPLSGFDLSVSSISRNGISAKRVQVSCETNTKSRDYKKYKCKLFIR